MPNTAAGKAKEVQPQQQEQLSLVVRRVHFDDILAGKQKTETREVRHNNATRYLLFSDSSREEQSVVGPRKYKTLRLFAGYEKDRPHLVVEVKSAEFIILTDDEGKDLTYMHEGEEYLKAIVQYKVGKVISRHNC